MGHMAAGVAHDFNNMLHGVMGALDLMRTRVGEGRMDELPDLLQTAQMSLRRTPAFTHSLLAFWRPRSVEWERICINTEIVSIEGLLRCTLGEGIALEFQPTNGIPSIACDPHQLENAAEHGGQCTGCDVTWGKDRYPDVLGRLWRGRERSAFDVLEFV